ncbi:MAG: glycosyl hydrolase family 5 [Alphaproteobacteria bacterium]|nr:glycosyl hydrolase family 5 [Alphaproteobacteria bacterium]
MRRLFVSATLVSAFVLAAPHVADGQSARDRGQPAGPPTAGAVLQGLDKVTARISTFDAPFDTPVRFGSLEIQVRACHKAPPTEAPESTAFLEIEETFETNVPRDLFVGWMFASSPAVSALEHPVYDVWVVDCMKASNSASDSSG